MEAPLLSQVEHLLGYCCSVLGGGYFGNRNHGSGDLYIPGDLLESLSPFQRLLMLTGQDKIRQQQQHDDDGTTLQHSVGFVGQQHGNEDDTPPAPAQEQQVPLNPSQSASSQMGRSSQRQLARDFSSLIICLPKNGIHSIAWRGDKQPSASTLTLQL